MAKITYTDKVDSVTNPAAAINKVVAADLNEIKTSVNLLYDLADLRQFTYTQLISAISGSTLVAGEKIVLTDFATTHYMLNGDGGIILDGVTPVINTGITEPLIITVLSTNKVSNIVESALYPQDIIHYDWNGENWKFDLAFGSQGVVLTGWKGVIYFRHDTINDVSMGHDFRHVLNRRWKKNYATYNAGTSYSLSDVVQDNTGAYMSNTNANIGNLLSNTTFWIQIIDYSITSYVCSELSAALSPTDFIDVPCFYSQEVDPLSQYNREVESVHLKPFKDNINDFYGVATILQNNVFALGLNFGSYQVIGISAEIFCYKNTFLGYQEGNTFNSFCFSNILGDDFFQNSINSEFTNNIIGRVFHYNETGSNFSTNQIGLSFKSNIVGSTFNGNQVGSSFNSNTIESNINNTNFLTATHVYQTYNCNLSVAEGGAKKLSYINSTGVQVIVDATA